MRRAYLDNIRWATVLLVLAYHVCYLFNGVGVPGGIPGAESLPALDMVASIVYPWFMVLLFAVSGMSARYSPRTEKQFIRERMDKLLVPSTLGLFVIHWITGFLNIKMSGGLAYIPPALLYPISVLSGIGPLWFIQMLFLFSVLLVLLRKADRHDRLWALCDRVNLPILLLLVVPIWGAAQVLNVPVLTMYRFGIYLTAFLIGYYVLSHDSVQAVIERACIPLTCLSALCAVLYALRYAGENYTAPACLQSALTNLYLWLTVLAVIGCAKRFFDWETAFTRAMTRSSFSIYILHYPALIGICCILHDCFDLPASWNYTLALILQWAAAFALAALIRKIPVLRYLVLGIRKKQTTSSFENRF